MDHMLQKDPENFHVDRFRPINFLEADANFNLKFMARRAMAHGEDNNIIAKEQYGSKKQHSSETQALNKRLTYDAWCLRKTPGVLCSNDAKSCYDRILHVIEAICLRRFGLEKGPISSMIETLQGMAHMINTAWGTCDGYGPEVWHWPLQGILQGNGAGPCIWLVISVTIFSMMWEEGFGIKFTTQVSKETGHLVGYAIVDNADIVETAASNSASGDEILNRAQEGLDHWEGGLRATGGAIVPKKSHWCYVDFEWIRGRWKYAPFDKERQLWVRDESGRKVQLEQVPVNEARRTLGVYLSPDGNNSDMKRVLLNKARTWAEHIRLGHLGRDKSWRALRTTIHKTIEFSLLSTTFTKKDLREIMGPVLKQGLSQSGFANTFQREIV